MKKRAALILALIFAAIAIVPAAALSRDGACLMRGQAGTVVDDFSSGCLNGDTIDGSVFEGYPLSVVVYWATWSADALRQLEYLASLKARRPDIEVLGLLYTDNTSTPAAAQAYMQAHGYDFPVFTADAVWLSVTEQSAYLPQSFFISPGGVILEAYNGAFSSADAMLEKAVSWAGAPGSYTVRFYDRIGRVASLIVTYSGLSYGASVEAPAVPQHEGYVFQGWSGSAYTNVTGNIDVFAVFSATAPDGDIDGNGLVNSYDALAVLRAVMSLAPVTPAILEHGDMDGNGVITSYDALLILRAVMYPNPIFS